MREQAVASAVRRLDIWTVDASPEVRIEILKATISAATGQLADAVGVGETCTVLANLSRAIGRGQ